MDKDADIIFMVKQMFHGDKSEGQDSLRAREIFVFFLSIDGITVQAWEAHHQ